MGEIGRNEQNLIILGWVHCGGETVVTCVAIEMVVTEVYGGAVLQACRSIPASNRRTSKNYRCNQDIANIDEGFIEEVGFCLCVV
jgi:hypothetical protein